RGVGGEDAGIGADVRQIAVEDRRGEIRAAVAFAPHDEAVRALVVSERDVSLRALADCVDRLDRPARAVRDEDEAIADHRDRRRVRRLLAEAPELPAGRWV